MKGYRMFCYRAYITRQGVPWIFTADTGLDPEAVALDSEHRHAAGLMKCVPAFTLVHAMDWAKLIEDPDTPDNRIVGAWFRDPPVITDKGPVRTGPRHWSKAEKLIRHLAADADLCGRYLGLEEPITAAVQESRAAEPDPDPPQESGSSNEGVW